MTITERLGVVTAIHYYKHGEASRLYDAAAKAAHLQGSRSELKGLAEVELAHERQLL